MSKHRIKEEEFQFVKLLFDKGLSNPEVMRVSKLSHATLSRIKKAETFEEYKAMTSVRMERERKSDKERFDVKEVIPYDGVVLMLKYQNELLQSISENLQKLISELI